MRPSSVSRSTVPPAPAVTARSTASAVAGDTIAAMICPPSKASSMRIESSDRAHHLGQDAVDGVGMEERDMQPEEPAPRNLVDQLGARVLEAGEGRTDVVDLVGHVVHPRAALGEKASHRCVVTRGDEELDPARADEDGGSFDALLRDRVPMLEPRAEEAAVRLHRLVEIGHREADVVDSPERHAAI